MKPRTLEPRASRLVASGLLIATSLLAFGATVSCGADFRPKNAVEGVRILATKADLPYARPGETVKLEALVADGRKTPSEPMRFFWFPAPCVDPPGGQYYGCYLYFDALYPLGVDLTSQLREAKDTTITIPSDALTKAIPRPGLTERFATAYVFMVACAGHVERVPRQGGQNLNALPIGCIGSNGVRRGPEDFVLGFTRVFVFESRRNTLPVLDGLTLEGNPVDVTKGITTGKCVKNKQDECNTVKLDVNFNDIIAEQDPENVDENGNVGRETIYVDWFTSIGKFNTDRKIVFDGNLGRPPKTAIEFSPPDDPTKGTFWAVLHDNRGGTTWLEVPVEIQ